MAVDPVADSSLLRQPESKKGAKTPERSGDKKFNNDEALTRIPGDEDKRAFLKKRRPKEAAVNNSELSSNTLPNSQKGKFIDEIV